MGFCQLFRPLLQRVSDLTKEEDETKKEELEASDDNEHNFKITATIRSYLKGNKTGKYIDGTIEIVYIYDFVGEIKELDIDPDSPVTEVESNDIAGYTLFTNILILLAIIIKKRF